MTAHSITRKIMTNGCGGCNRFLFPDIKNPPFFSARSFVIILFYPISPQFSRLSCSHRTNEGKGVPFPSLDSPHPRCPALRLFSARKKGYPGWMLGADKWHWFLVQGASFGWIRFERFVIFLRILLFGGMFAFEDGLKLLPPWVFAW